MWQMHKDFVVAPRILKLIMNYMNLIYLSTTMLAACVLYHRVLTYVNLHDEGASVLILQFGSQIMQFLHAAMLIKRAFACVYF